jgi:hypothetical protein
MPAGSRKQRRTLYASLATGTLVAGALAYTGLVDPHNRTSTFPVCPFRMLTGWYCPGCGALRMTYDLLHADIGAAIVDNAFILIGLPALLAWLLWRRHAGRPMMTMWSGGVVIAITVAWTVARNVPGFPLVPSLSSG